MKSTWFAGDNIFVCFDKISISQTFSSQCLIIADVVWKKKKKLEFLGFEKCSKSSKLQGAIHTVIFKVWFRHYNS